MGLAWCRSVWLRGKYSTRSPSPSYAPLTFTSSTAESTSSIVRASPVMPFSSAQYFTATRSNHPHRLGRPVVEPYSCPTRRKVLPVSSKSSVGKGPSPTRVVYALVTPTISPSIVGGSPAPTHAPPADGFEEVTNG